MNDTTLTRISGVFALLSPTLLVVMYPIAAPLFGFGGPGPINFGSAAVLEKLHAAGSAPILVDTLALIGPMLALPVGLGWYQLTKRAGSYVVLGVLLWYFSMTFTILQDALQLSLVMRLPQAFAAADAGTRSAILVFGDVAANAIKIVALAPSPINVFGLTLLGIGMMRTSRPWLGAIGIASFLPITAGVFIAYFAPGHPLGLLVPAGFVVFMLWMAATGVAMLRWKPDAARA